MESKDNKNAILAVVLSGIILFGWNYFFAPETYTPIPNTSDVLKKTSTKNQGLECMIPTFGEFCFDDLGKEAFMELFKTIHFTNTDDANPSFEIKDNTLFVGAKWSEVSHFSGTCKTAFERILNGEKAVA